MFFHGGLNEGERKLVLLLLLYNALTRYNIDVCDVPTKKKCFRNHIVRSHDFGGVWGRLLVQSDVTGLKCNAIFVKPNK